MKNKKFFTIILGTSILLIVLSSVSLYAQSEIPDITGVNEVSIQIACKLTLIQGEKASLKITGDEKVLDDINIKITGERLKLYNDKNYKHKNDVYVTITLPDLKQLSLGGAVDIITPNMLIYNDLTIDVSGVVDFDLKLKSKSFKLNTSGVLGGAIIGETGSMKIDISGVGKMDATKFKSQNCEVNISGVARVHVNVIERLDASVSGMGKINYMGDPIINSNTSGIGRINKL